MAFSKITRGRATRAANMIKALAGATVPFSGEIILSDKSVFSCREFDNCFEMGDSEGVVACLMEMYRADAELQGAFKSPLGSRYVCLEHWTEIAAKWSERNLGAELALA